MPPSSGLPVPCIPPYCSRLALCAVSPFPCSYWLSGTVTVKVLPFPGVELTLIVPPCCSTIALAIKKTQAKPVGTLFFAGGLVEPRKNRGEIVRGDTLPVILYGYDGALGTPWGAHLRPTSIPLPAFPYLTALCNRLEKTCVRRWLSPRTMGRCPSGASTLTG